MDWRRTFLAPVKSPAPIRCATCTEKPVAAAAHSPQNNHVVVDTSPIEAEAFAPKLPTIDASTYCMAIEDNCAIIAGTLRYAVNSNCCFSVIFLPSPNERIKGSRFYFPCSHRQTERLLIRKTSPFVPKVQFTISRRLNIFVKNDFTITVGDYTAVRGFFMLCIGLLIVAFTLLYSKARSQSSAMTQFSNIRFSA